MKHQWSRLLAVVILLVAGLVSTPLSLLAQGNDNSAIVPIMQLLFGDRVNLASNLEYSPGTVYSLQTTSVTTAITLSGEKGPASLDLWQCDENGTLQQKVGTLSDDGNLVTGDDIANDGVYHGILSVQPANDADLFYRVSGAITSPPARLAVVDNVDDAVLANIQSQVNQAKVVYDAVISGAGTEAQAQAAVLAYLDTLANVAEKGPAETGFGTWWITDEGVACAHNPNEYKTDIRAGGAVRNPDPPLPEALKTCGPLLPVNHAVAEAVGAFSGSELWSANAVATNEVKSKEALLLRIYNFGTDELPEIQTELDGLCYNTTLVNLTTTLDHFKNLLQYGVFAVVGHGDTFYQGWQTLWFPEWGSEKGAAQVIINMPVAYDSTTMKMDLLAGRLALTPSSRIAVMPAFISYYNSNLPNSLIYIGTCRSARNASLANSFLNDGAGSFFGFTDYVGTLWAESRGQNLFQHLADGNTTGTNPENGMTETDADPATFMLYGSTSLTIVKDGFANGDFEEGTLAGWSPLGDSRIITGLGWLSPPQGIFMAIVSTGLGSVSDSTSTLSQQVTPTTEKHILSFRYNVVSEEPLEFIGSVFDDYFELIVEGNVTRLESINTSSWFELGGDYFFGGDSTTFHTGWKTYTLDLTAYIGSCITIQFKTGDVGDSIYDTAALLDSIELK